MYSDTLRYQLLLTTPKIKNRSVKDLMDLKLIENLHKLCDHPPPPPPQLLLPITCYHKYLQDFIVAMFQNLAT